MEKDVVAFSTLGKNGRFANNIFQYAFLRIYAQQHDLRVETPAWTGRELFGINDPPVSRRLPTLYDWSSDVTTAFFPNARRVFRNINIWGWFQYHTSFYRPHKKLFRSLFQPTEKIQESLTAGVQALRSRGRTVVGFHLRRGDYGEGDFYIAPNAWYQQWLKENWRTFDNPVLFIASDEIDTVTGDFDAYKPVTSGGLGVSLPDASFYPDFYLLTQCDILAVSNSSFSVSACMLNEQAKNFYRPGPKQRGLIAFDPWDCEVLDRETGKAGLQHLEPDPVQEERFAGFSQMFLSLCKNESVEKALQFYDRNRGRVRPGRLGGTFDSLVAGLRLKTYG